MPSLDDMNAVIGQPDPGPNLVGAQGTPAPAAASAIAHRATVPPALGMGDPTVAAQAGQLAANQRALANRPGLSQWVAKDPANAAVAGADIPALGAISDALDFWTGGFKATQAAGGVVGQDIANRDASKQLEHLGSLAIAAGGDIGGPALRALMGAPRAGAAGLTDLLARVPGLGYGQQSTGPFSLDRPSTREEAINAWQNTFNMALMAIAPARTGTALVVPEGPSAAGTGMGPAPSPHPIVGGWELGPDGTVLHPGGKGPVEFANAKEAAQWAVQANKITPHGVNMGLVNGAEEGTYGLKAQGEPLAAPGTDPMVDPLHQATAQEHAATVEGVQEQLANTQVARISPEATEDLLSHTSAGQVSVWVDPQALAGLYAQGHVIFPELGAEVSDALSSGREVEVPLSKYLAQTSGQPFAAELNKATRFTADGVSVNEAKELGKGEEPGPSPSPNQAPTMDPATLTRRASDSVEKAFQTHFLSGVFAEPETVGLSKPEFVQYSAEVEKTQAAIRAKMVDKITKQLAHERTPEWKAEVAQQRAGVERTFADRRDIRARQELQYGEGPMGEPLDRPGIKLSKGHTVRQFGQGVVDSLPGSMFRASPDLAKGSMQPDDAAELFGYDSGEELIRDLVALEKDRVAGGFKSSRDHLKQSIELQAEWKARNALGFDVSPEGLRAAANDLVTGPEVTDLLTNQMKLLAQMVGLPISSLATRADALRLFADLPAGEAAKTSTFVTGMQRTGRAVETALRKKDWTAALKAKQDQFTNHVQYRLSKDFLRTYNSKRRQWADLAESASKPTIDQGFLDAIHQELRKYGYQVPQANIAYRYELWREEAVAQGFSVLPPETIRPVPVKDLTVEEFTDLANRIENMRYLGHKAQQVISANATVDMAQTVTEAQMGTADLRAKGIPTTGVVKRNPLSELNRVFSQVQHLLDLLDDNNANGVFNRVLMIPARAAHAKELELRTEILHAIDGEYDKFTNVEKAALMRNVPGGHGLRAFWGDKPEVELKVKDLLGIALNLGTDLNRWHVEDGGWGWTPAQYQPLLDRYFTPKMIDFVNAVHGIMETKVWPKMAAHEFATTGLAPSKETPTPFTIAGQRMTGGYFTLAKDPRWAVASTSSPDISAMFKDKIIVPSTPTGFIKKRVSAQYAVNLNWTDTLFHHVNDVTKRLAYGDYVSSAMRFMAQKEVKFLVAEYGGPEAQRAIMDSLQRQTGVGLVGADTHGVLDQALRGARSRFYLVTSATKLAILVEHATALVQVGQVAGMATAMRGWARYASNPISGYKFAWENSPYLRGRHSEIDINMRDLADDMDGEGKGLAPFIDRQFAAAGVNTDVGLPFRLTQRGAMAVLQWVNHYTVAVPNWLGAYHDALDGKASLKGTPQPAMDHAEAVAFGDKVVSEAHGSGAEMDMSKVQSGFGELWKFLNVFYSYHGNQFNLNKMAVTKVLQGRDAGERAKGLWFMFLGLMAPVVAKLVQGQEYHKLIGPKADMDSALSWLVDADRDGLAAEVPFARGLNTAERTWEQTHQIDYAAKDVSPALQMPVTVAKAAEDLRRMGTGGQPFANPIRDVITGAGYVLGIAGASQIGNTAQGLADLDKPDNIHPVLGAMFGPYAEKDHETPQPGGTRSTTHHTHGAHWR